MTSFRSRVGYELVIRVGSFQIGSVLPGLHTCYLFMTDLFSCLSSSMVVYFLLVLVSIFLFSPVSSCLVVLYLDVYQFHSLFILPYSMLVLSLPVFDSHLVGDKVGFGTQE